MAVRVRQGADARNPHQLLEARIIFRAGFFAGVGQGQQLRVTLREIPHGGRSSYLRSKAHSGEHDIELLFGDHGLAGTIFARNVFRAGFRRSSVLWANAMDCHHGVIRSNVIGIK